MDCGDCLKKLYPYLDRELSEHEARVVKAHLDRCRGCADHFVFEEHFLAKVRDVGADERAPERLRQAIVLRLRQS